MNVEDLLREAISDHVAGVPESPDTWEQIEAQATRARRRARVRNRAVTALGLVAAGVAAVLVIPNLGHDAGRRHVVTSPSPTMPAPAETPTTGETPTTKAPAPAPAFAYVPLWPFRSQAEADAWRRDASSGHQPWHADADQTALSFTQGFLGFNEIDRVTTHTIGPRDARVSVGFATTGTQTSTAAVIHLVRMGTSADGPWEVVGTDDTTLTVANPRYGATVKSPMIVEGTITGVDEMIHVEVRQPSSPGRLGDFSLAAGGDRTPWGTKVAFFGGTDPALTVVAWTGGHFQRVETFAVTGVRPAA